MGSLQYLKHVIERKWNDLLINSIRSLKRNPREILIDWKLTTRNTAVIIVLGNKLFPRFGFRQIIFSFDLFMFILRVLIFLFTCLTIEIWSKQNKSWKFLNQWLLYIRIAMSAFSQKTLVAWHVWLYVSYWLNYFINN